VIRIFTEARVGVITFAPHTPKLFQVFVLTFFGVLKGCPRYELLFDDGNATATVITKVYHDFTHTMAPFNVWRAFRALALEFDKRRMPSGLLLDEVKLRESAAFQELTSVDFPLDQLSGRRHIAQFGWINKPE
jgi:hypothetical protein